MQLSEIHRAQTAGKQQLLGIKQLIQLVGGLLPGNKRGYSPCQAGEQEEKQRQTNAQA